MSTKKMRKIERNLGEAHQKMLHEKIRDQHRKIRRKLLGIYQYFGVRGNYIRICGGMMEKADILSRLGAIPYVITM